MSQSDAPTWWIYTDGASRGNPGPGGWAIVMLDSEGNVFEAVGGEPETTNNRMELFAAIRALEEVQRRQGRAVIYTDSSYVIQGLNNWVHLWMRRDWKTQGGDPVINRDLWERLHKLAEARRKKGGLNLQHVPGHAGVPGNERADELAVRFATGQRVDTFRGRVEEYFIPLKDGPKATLTHPMSAKKRKTGKPYSYLSLIGRSAVRHRNWTACEKRVKGQAGAKFKKAMTPEEESLILSSWGVQVLDVQDDRE